MRGQFSAFSGVGGGSGFPDPFADMASLAVPTNWRNCLQWSEYIFNSFGTYRMAMERLGVQPYETLFLDDFPAMVDAARSLGMVVVHVQDHDTAIAEARGHLGVTTSSRTLA